VVGIETFVFRRENGVEDISGHVFQRELVAESLRDAGFPERDTVAIEESDALNRRSQQRGWNGNKLKHELAREHEQRKHC